MLYTVQAIKLMLRIDKHELDRELEMQGEVLHHITEALASAKTRTLRAKDDLERTEANVVVSNKDGRKVSVAELKGIALNDSTRKTRFSEFVEARHEQEVWEGLFEAWKERGFALRKLVDLRLANYYTSDSSRPKEQPRYRQQYTSPRSGDANTPTRERSSRTEASTRPRRTLIND